MFKFLNKGISTSMAIIIIVACALLVGGIVAWQYYGMPKGEELVEVKPPEEIMPPEDETVDWETYRNEEYGFEFKYPPLFEFREFDPLWREELYNKEPREIGLGYFEGAGQLPVFVRLEKLDPDNIKGMYGKIPKERLKTLIVAGRESYAFTEGHVDAGMSLIINIPNKNITIELVFTEIDENTTQEILSTFRFLE